MLSDTIVRAIRTFVPIAIGAALTALGRAIGIQIDSASLAIVVVPLVIAAYWTLVKFLERKFPSLGWLLGVPLTKTAPIAAPAQTVPVGALDVTPQPGHASGTEAGDTQDQVADGAVGDGQPAGHHDGHAQQ